MSLRLRIVLITTAAVTAVFAVAGVLNIIVVRAEFIHSADEIGQERADVVGDLAMRGQLPAVLPQDNDADTVVQVVRAGRVVSGTPSVAHGPPLPLPQVPPGTTQVVSLARLPVANAGPYRTTIRGTATPDGPATIYVAVSTEDIEDIIQATVRNGSIALLLLILPLVTVLWIAIGRTLAPVEAIRERAQAITGRHLDQRVPEPEQVDEIGRLARTINQMLERLHESSERQRRFLADAAHELRSPVTSLRAQLETAEEHDGTQIREVVPDLLADTLRMQAITDELLLLARSDAGLVVRLVAPVDLDDVVETVVASQRLEDGLDGVEVDATGVHPVQTLGDPGLLEQVVRNLVDNAVGYASTRVRVSLTAVDGEAILTVDDDGPGIPVEHREAVFLRFTRLDDSRDRRNGGVGLGLAIVQGIVEAHGGTVTAEDSPIGGARLRVTLPLADA